MNKLLAMSKKGPIIIIEDDVDDKEIFEKVIRDLGIANKLVWHETADQGLEYLKTTSEHPFIIFCDVNLPGKNGLEFKKKIDDNPELRKKSIPFVFYSTSAAQQDVNEAYVKMTVQGFFKKGTDYNQMKTQIKLIFDYWEACIHPNIA